jgi:hypothetical protein
MAGGAYITGWALESNFAPGSNPWNGQPCKVAPTGDLFIPGTVAQGGTGVPAEWLNSLFNAQAAAIKGTQQAAYLRPVQSWGAEQAITPFTGTSVSLMDACWDASTNLWLVAIFGTTGPQISVFGSYGLDGNTQATWAAFGTVGANPNANVSIAPDANTAGHIWLGISSSASGGSFVTYVWGGSSWTSQSTFFSGVAPLPSGALFGTIHPFNGKNVLALGSLAGNGGGFYQASGGTALFSITGVTTGPIKMADNTGNGGPGNLLVAVPTETGTFVYWTSPDGVTWTQRSLGTLNPNQSIFGICWTQDAVGPCFLVGINEPGKVALFARSADGITWTLQSTPNMAEGTDLAAVGPSVYTALVDASSTGPSGGAFSIDGGVTWYFSQAVLTTNLALGSYYTPRSVVASSFGLLSFNSLWFRFSALAGVPATSL